jgi:hypothetical protein
LGENFEFVRAGFEFVRAGFEFVRAPASSSFGRGVRVRLGAGPSSFGRRPEGEFGSFGAAMIATRETFGMPRSMPPRAATEVPRRYHPEIWPIRS